MQLPQGEVGTGGYVPFYPTSCCQGQYRQTVSVHGRVHTYHSNDFTLAPLAPSKSKFMDNNKEKFLSVYTDALTHCVQTMPERYGWPASQAPEVAVKMCAAIERGTVNVDGPAFRRAARVLGIKPTRKAITAFYNGESPCQN